MFRVNLAVDLKGGFAKFNFSALRLPCMLLTAACAGGPPGPGPLPPPEPEPLLGLGVAIVCARDGAARRLQCSRDPPRQDT